LPAAKETGAWLDVVAFAGAAGCEPAGAELAAVAGAGVAGF